MIAHEERMLEISLAEVVGGLRVPDVRDAVVAALRTPRTRRRVLVISGLVAAAAVVGLLLVPRIWKPSFGSEHVAKVDAWLRELRAGDDPTQPSSVRTLLAQRRWLAQVELLDFVEANPDGWPYLRARLRESLSGDLPGDARSRLVEVCAHDRLRQEVAALLRSQIAEHGGTMSSEALIVLAELGLTEAERHLRRMPRPGLDFVPHTLWLVQHGDKGGLAALAMILAWRHVLDLQPAAYLAAALVLHGSGDEDAWGKATRMVAEKTTELLDGRRLADARRLVLQLEWFHARLADTAPLRLGELRRTVHHYAEEHAAGLSNADEVRTRLARLRK